MHVNRTILTVMLVLVGVALTACTSVTGRTPPDLELVVNAESYSATQSSYCWNGECADFVYPPVVDSFVPLSSGEEIVLLFDRPQPDYVFLRLDLYSTFPDAESAATFRLEDVPDPIRWTPDVAKGDYVLSISAKWDSGQDSAYFIGVTIP